MAVLAMIAIFALLLLYVTAFRRFCSALSPRTCLPHGRGAAYSLTLTDIKHA